MFSLRNALIFVFIRFYDIMQFATTPSPVIRKRL
jgi:hypothetical protein